MTDPRTAFLHCALDPAYFTARYVHIYDATRQTWLPFALWPAQRDVLRTMASERKLVVLKARQLGISWLSLAYALWLLQCRPPATVLLFSLREAEAKELLWRLKGMYARLPPWLQARRITKDNENRWELSNGSRALAFSTKGGRSYTGTFALVDEADFVPDLNQFLNAVKPTIDAGGQLCLVSTSDKRRPVSTFKNLFRASLQGTGDYRHIFLPWHARPDRDARWHAVTKAEMFAQRGTNDDFMAEYPATPEEALAPEQLDRRLPLEWVLAVSETGAPILTQSRSDAEMRREGESGRGGEEDFASSSAFLPASASLRQDVPALPGLAVWEEPIPGRRYVIGVDPAEGNVHSDESVACVLDGETWAQVAILACRVEPATFAGYVAELAGYYNGADVLVERNNHGHLVIRELAVAGGLRLLDGYDKRPGWLSNVKGKPLLYGLLAAAVKEGVCRVRDLETANQLASIEASTLRAPSGLHDDRADAFALAVAGVAWQGEGVASMVVAAGDPLEETTGW